MLKVQFCPLKSFDFLFDFHINLQVFFFFFFFMKVRKFHENIFKRIHKLINLQYLVPERAAICDHFKKWVVSFFCHIRLAYNNKAKL